MPVPLGWRFNHCVSITERMYTTVCTLVKLLIAESYTAVYIVRMSMNSQGLFMAIDMDRIGSRMVELYQRQGMNRNQFVKAGGFAYQQVMDWESGAKMPTLPMLAKIADTLKVSLGELTGEESRYEYELTRYPDPKGWSDFLATRAKDYNLSTEQLEQLRRVKFRGGGSVLDLCNVANIFVNGGVESLSPHPLAVEADAKIAAEEKATGVKKPRVDLTKPKEKKKR